MSAYIVDNATIDAIVTWAINGPRYTYSIPHPDGGVRFVGIKEVEPDVLGQLLLNENYISVNERYREKDLPPKYTFREVLSRKVGTQNKLLNAVDIIKLVHCLRYQSCEHAGWEQSWAKRFLDAVVDQATHCLPGYDDAPWGLNDDEVGSVISLSSLVSNPSKRRRA